MTMAGIILAIIAIIVVGFVGIISFVIGKSAQKRSIKKILTPLPVPPKVS